MSWPAEQGSTFSGPAEELKYGSSRRAASLPRMVPCSVSHQGWLLETLLPLSPVNSASPGAECHPPSARVREEKAGQRLGRALEHWNIVCWEAVWIRNSWRLSGPDEMPGRGIRVC